MPGLYSNIRVKKVLTVLLIAAGLAALNGGISYLAMKTDLSSEHLTKTVLVASFIRLLAYLTLAFFIYRYIGRRMRASTWKMNQKVEERTLQLKQYAEALQKSEKKNRDLINYSQALICTHDLSGVLLSVNPALCTSLGYDEKEMVGKSIRDFIAPDHVDKFPEYISAIAGTDKTEGIMCVQSREGQKKYYFYKNYKLSEDDEQPYIIGFSQDVTRLVMAEKELKKAKAAAEESSRTKELFLASMSHEIRTPMNGIIGMCSLLSKTRVSDEQAHYLKLIKSSADNLLVIINDILDISKINAGKLNLENVPFNLPDTIQAAVQSLQFKAQEKDLLLEIVPFTLQNPWVAGDSHRLTQILINLFNNAIKFTERGRVQLIGKIISESETDLVLEFCVRDTGIGIPKQRIETIFDEFTQAAADTTRKYGGTGLGLSICKRLVEMQEGRIWVESAEHQGSDFKFILPYKKSVEQVAAKQEAPVPNDGSLTGIKVLLAEDNEVNREYASALMKKWGCLVDAVSDGLDAVVASQKKDYDVVLMDIQMPGMGGMEAVRLMRYGIDKKRAQVPVIALTANVFGENYSKYASAGMQDYIYKPFEEDRLFAAIRGCVGRNKSVTSAGASAKSDSQKKSGGPAAGYKIPEGDAEFQQKMARLFIKLFKEAVENLKKYSENEDWQKVRFSAHKVKPNIDKMHQPELKEMVRKIENYYPEQHETNITELISVFSATLNEMITKLEAADFDASASFLAA